MRAALTEAHVGRVIPPGCESPRHAPGLRGTWPRTPPSRLPRACGSMERGSTEVFLKENRMITAEKLAREVLAALSSGDIERVGPLVADDFIDHGAPPWAPQGRAGYLR